MALNRKARATVAQQRSFASIRSTVRSKPAAAPVPAPPAPAPLAPPPQPAATEAPAPRGLLRFGSQRHRYFGILLTASGLLILATIILHDLLMGEASITLGIKSYAAIAITVVLTFAALFVDSRSRNHSLQDRSQELNRITDELRDTVGRLQSTNEELVQAREQAVAADRAKTTFLANMSHEIRTPLNGVLGYAQILARDPTLTRRQRSMVETISASGAQLLALLNDILDLSKIEAGAIELRPADFDLGDLLRGVVALHRPKADEKGIVLDSTGLARGKMPVHGDQMRLRQVLTNLVDNAIKFTDSGRVILECQPRPPDRYFFSVTDTGAGISPETLRKLFEPFQQGSEGARRGGTGLGLAISRRQVELLGGKLQVESTAGHGSRFHFEARLVPSTMDVQSRGVRRTRTVKLAAGATVRTLVVDTDAVNRDVLCSLLEESGCDVRAAASLAMALDASEAWDPHCVFIAARTKEPALEEVLDHLASSPAGGPRIIAVGPPDDRTAQAWRRAGCHDVLDHPIRGEAIYACLRTHLGVAFQVEESGPPRASLPADGEHAPAALPPELRQRLIDAARASSVTDLRRSIDDVAKLGPEAQSFADRLAVLARTYDMTAILRMLEAGRGR